MFQPIFSHHKIMLLSGGKSFKSNFHINVKSKFLYDIIIFFRLYSNNQNGREIGFSLSYNSHDEAASWSFRIGSCGGAVTTAQGLLTSPSFPDSYPNDVDCNYTISRPDQTFINITISNFDALCGDKLELWDGNTDISQKMAQFCGDGEVIPPYLLTSTNNLRMRYRHIIGF